jgi:hypothetical protein
MFSRPGEPPTDRKMFLVRDAIDEVAVKSFEKHVRGDGWTMRSCVVGSGTNSGAHEWRSRFACLPAGEDYYTSQKLFALREADFARVMVPIQWDVLEAVRRTNVSFTSSHMTGVETHPGVRSARFEFGYLRHGGKVAGSVVGTLTPCDRDPLWVDLVVSVKEWTTGWSPDVQDGRVPP